jgi:hypothetical protein
MNKLVQVILCASVILGGCATASKNVGVRYISPARYQPYNCYQLSAEYRRIKGRLVQLGGRLDESASKDSLRSVFGAIIFFPALFVLGGNEQEEAEYGALKGEYDAVQQAAFVKKCSNTAPSIDDSLSAEKPK